MYAESPIFNGLSIHSLSAMSSDENWLSVLATSSFFFFPMMFLEYANRSQGQRASIDVFHNLKIAQLFSSSEFLYQIPNPPAHSPNNASAQASSVTSPLIH